jgi:glutamate synthase domain-containing protein 1
MNLHVGTDSEAIFLETDYLLRNGFSIEEIEWIISGKYPQELLSLNNDDLKRYNNIKRDPILKRMKMSGPATAIVMIGDVILGYTDRDHLRSFSLGYNDRVALLGSEQRAILSAAYFMEEELKSVYDPDAGKVVAFQTTGKNIKKLDYGWKWHEA